MKKGLLTIGAFLCLTMTINAQVYSENFESADTWTAEQAWAAFSTDTDTLGWGLYDLSTDPDFGTMGIAPGSASWETVALTPDNYFLSPAIDLSTYNSLSLAFKYAAADPSYPAENFAVYAISVVDGNLATALATATPVYTETIATGGVINTQNIDISSVAGGDSVYVVFRHFNCTDQYLLLVDDINITNTAGMEEMALETIVYPNPAVDVLNIQVKENMTSVAILSTEGKLISTQEVNGLTTSVNVSSLNTGVYMYQITTANGVTVTNTFVKK